MSNQTSTPVYRRQSKFGISAAVFVRQHEDRTFPSVNLQKSYIKNGEWARHNLYLDHEHIPFVIDVLQATWRHLNGELNADGPPSLEEASVSA